MSEHDPLPDLDEVGPVLLEVLDEDDAMSAFQVLGQRGYLIVRKADWVALEASQKPEPDESELTFEMWSTRAALRLGDRVQHRDDPAVRGAIVKRGGRNWASRHKLPMVRWDGKIDAETVTWARLIRAEPLVGRPEPADPATSQFPRPVMQDIGRSREPQGSPDADLHDKLVHALRGTRCECIRCGYRAAFDRYERALAGRPVPPLNEPVQGSNSADPVSRVAPTVRPGSLSGDEANSKGTPSNPRSLEEEQATIREALNAVLITDRANELWSVAEEGLAALLRLGERARRAESSAQDIREDSLELLALTLAHYGDADNTKLSDLIPQRVWDSLFARELLSMMRDITGEGNTVATTEGAELLLRSVEDLAKRTASATSDRDQAVAPDSESEVVAGLRAALAAAEADRDELRASACITCQARDAECETTSARLAVAETALRGLLASDALILDSPPHEAVVVARAALGETDA